ncbi:MAG: hypothetical protein LBG91_03090 [Treponema sp.]|jgi:hypothetical protein|nr:hypothetical protein [Treponema sp.]
MKLQILEDLYNEVNRLFIAGAKFAPNDPRISRLIPVLEKTGEKSPVIKKLAELTSCLAACETAEAPQALLETGTFLYAVLNTQSSTDPDEGYVPVNLPDFAGELPVTKTSYRTLKPVIEALTEAKSGRLEVLQNAYGNDMASDFRLAQFYSNALNDRYPEFVDFLFEKVIPSAGKPAIPFLLEDYDPKGKKTDSRRLSLLRTLGYENAPALAAQAVAENAHDDIQVAAIDILKDNSENEQLLLSLAGGKKAALREAALIALVKTNSEKGKKLLLETLQSANYTSGLEAAKACTDKETLKEIVEYTKTVYNDCKENDKKKKEAAAGKFHELVGVFLDSEEECAVDFCKEICADSKSKTLDNRDLDRIARRYFIWAVKAFSPEEVYKTFISLYRDKAFTYDSAFQKVFADSGAVFDKNWLGAFIGRNDIEFLILAMKPEDTEAAQFLAKYLDKCIQKMQEHGVACVTKLAEIGYQGLDKIVFSIFARCRQDWNFNYFCDAVEKNITRVFPKDYIGKLKDLHARIDNYRIGGVVENMKKIYGEE